MIGKYRVIGVGWKLLQRWLAPQKVSGMIKGRQKTFTDEGVDGIRLDVYRDIPDNLDSTPVSSGAFWVWLFEFGFLSLAFWVWLHWRSIGKHVHHRWLTSMGRAELCLKTMFRWYSLGNRLLTGIDDAYKINWAIHSRAKIAAKAHW